MESSLQHERVRGAPWVENAPSSRWLPRLDLREIWSYRTLALALAARDLKLRYRQTFFGVAWAVLQPLAAAAIFSVVFGRLAELDSDGFPYPVFVFAGLVVWTYFATGIQRAAESLVEVADMVTKIYFPRLLAPVAAVLPGLLDLAISLVVLAGFMVGYGVAPGPQLALFPAIVVATAVLAAGIGLWLSALNVQYRDVRHALTFVVQVWLFATPVVYSSAVLEDAWRYVFALNPMVGLIDAFRWSILDGPPPGVEDLISLASGLAVIAGGLVYFQRTERRFADVI